MGPSSSRTMDSRSPPAVFTYPDVIIALAVLLARYGQSILYPRLLLIFDICLRINMEVQDLAVGCPSGFPPARE